MTEKKFTLDVEVVTKQAQQELKNASKEAKKLGENIDDTRTAGKKFADAMGDVADEIQKELGQARKASQQLEKALGPELTKALNESGKSVDNLVAEFHKAGLSYQDIEHDTEALAGAIRKMNTVADSVDDHVSKPIGHVAEKTDKATNALENFYGNAIQEVPGISDTFGPLNTAIGQVAEGIAAGEVGLGSLVAAAAPMAAIAGGFMIVNGILNANKKAAEEDKKIIELFKKAIIAAGEDGSSVAHNLAKGWSDAGGVFVKVQKQIQMAGASWGDSVIQTVSENVKLDDSLYKMGVTYEQFAQAVLNNGGDLKEWIKTVDTSKLSGDEFNNIISAGPELMKDYGKSAEDVKKQLFLQGQTASQAATDNKALTDEWQKQTEYLAKLNDELTTNLGLIGSLESDTLKLNLSYDDLTTQIKDASKAVDDGKTSINEKKQAFEKVGIALNDFAQQESDLADKQAIEQGYVKGSGPYWEAYIKNLEKLQGQYPATKEQLQKFIDLIKNSPAVQELEFRIKTTSYMGESARAGIPIVLNGPKIPKKASGGFAGGTTLVGENGPELVDLPSGSFVHTANETSRMSNGYIDNRNITVNVSNMTPNDTALAITRYNKRAGL